MLSTQLHADSGLGHTDATTLQVMFAIPLSFGGWLAFTAWMMFVCSQLTGASSSSLRTAAADADHLMLSCIITEHYWLTIHSQHSLPVMLCHCDCYTLTLCHGNSCHRSLGITIMNTLPSIFCDVFALIPEYQLPATSYHVSSSA